MIGGILMKKWKKILKFFLVFFIICLVFYISLYVFAYFSKKLPVSFSSNYYFYDSEDNLYNGGNDNWVSLDQISDHLINATISIEDKNFYNHFGFDYLRIIKAMYNNIKSGDTVEGASTITQQFAKNLFLD